MTSGKRADMGAGEHGYGTVWVITLMALVWLVAVVAMTVGGVRAARHRADAAADLAALAAAAHAISGSERACADAGIIAREAQVRLVQCAVRDSIADVRVSATARVPGLGPIQVPARARAGPAGTPSTGRRSAVRNRPTLMVVVRHISNHVCGGRPPYCHRTVLFVTGGFGTLL